MYFLQFSNSYTTMEYCHDRCSKFPPCCVTHASLFIKDPRMRKQGVLGHMFVRIFLFCPWNTCLIYGLFFRNTLYSTTEYFISENTLVEAGRYKNPYFMQILMLSFIPCTVFYTIIWSTNCRALHCFLLSHITSCFYTFPCLLTPYYGTSIHLWFLHNTSYL